MVVSFWVRFSPLSPLHLGRGRRGGIKFLFVCLLWSIFGKPFFSSSSSSSPSFSFSSSSSAAAAAAAVAVAAAAASHSEFGF